MAGENGHGLGFKDPVFLDAVQDHRPGGIEQHLILVGIELAQVFPQRPQVERPLLPHTLGGITKSLIVFLGAFRVTLRVPVAPAFGMQPRVADHLGAEWHDHRPRSFAIAAVGAARRITRFIVLDLMGNVGNTGNGRSND